MGQWVGLIEWRTWPSFLTPFHPSPLMLEKIALQIGCTHKMMLESGGKRSEYGKNPQKTDILVGIMVINHKMLGFSLKFPIFSPQFSRKPISEPPLGLPTDSAPRYSFNAESTASRKRFTCRVTLQTSCYAVHHIIIDVVYSRIFGCQENSSVLWFKILDMFVLNRPEKDFHFPALHLLRLRHGLGTCFRIPELFGWAWRESCHDVVTSGLEIMIKVHQ